MQADMELLSPCCQLWPLEAEKLCFLWHTAHGGSEARVSLSDLSLQLMYNVYFYILLGAPSAVIPELDDAVGLDFHVLHGHKIEFNGNGRECLTSRPQAPGDG